MSKKPDIRKNMEEVMNSLDRIRRASPQPFLYTRIMARLAESKSESGLERFILIISKPSFTIAAITLFLLINLAVVFHFSSNSTTPSHDDSASVISDNEYRLSVSSLYDINPE